MLSKGIWTILTILIGGMIVIFLFRIVFNFFSPTQEESEAKNVKEEEIVDVSDVVNDPAVYSGLSLTLEGTITDWVTKRAYVLADSSGGILGTGLLVIHKDQFSLPQDSPANELALGEKTKVKVSGTVRELNLASLESEWATDLPDEEFQLYEGKPVMIADSVSEQ